ncbi:MFS transporter [Micrococcoides hystricis]|uniref:MFS transporter n=1 Tax=Micrococcoides hystricis TaxID=1572761 RepID=A0ABV6PCY0_9MICC
MSGQTPQSQKSATKIAIPQEINILIAAAFVIAIGFGIIAPVLPQYAHSFNASALAVSAIVSAFGLTRLLFAPISGRVTGRFGETPVYMTGVLIVALSMFLIAFAQSYWQLIIFRALGGVGSTLFTVSAMTFLARKSPSKIRGRVSGRYASAFLFGNIAGPILGGLLAGLGTRAPFLIYGGSLVVAAAIVFFALKDSRLESRENRDVRPVMSVGEALANPSYKAALASAFANGWSTFGVRNSLIPLFAATAFLGVSVPWTDTADLAPAALSLFALGNLVVVTTTSRFSDHYGRKPAILIGLSVAGITSGLLGFFDNPWVFLALCTIAGAGTGLLNPAQQASVADVIGRRQNGGKALATFQMSADLGAISGPLLAGLIADAFGYHIAFATTGLIMIIAAIVWYFSPETNVEVYPGGPRTGELPVVAKTQQLPAEGDQL